MAACTGHSASREAPLDVGGGGARMFGGHCGGEHDEEEEEGPAGCPCRLCSRGKVMKPCRGQ